MFTRRNLLLFGLAAVPAVALSRAMPAQAGSQMKLRAAPSAHRFMVDREPAPVLAYNGSIPGPVIRARRGDEVHVLFENRLTEASTVHWHGIRIDNAMDGVPGMTQDPVPPGGTFEYRFKVPDAGTYWYHPHLLASEQMGRGLYGALIVDGDADGLFEEDITLILDDWRLEEDGTISDTFGNAMDASHAGRLGNWMTVNGVSIPDIPLRAGALTRLRLINTANSRVLYLDLATLGATVVAVDGQPVATPYPGPDRFALAPSQRVDVAVFFGSEGRHPFRETSREPFEFANFEVAGSANADARRSDVKLAANGLAEPDIGKASRHVMIMQGGMMGQAFSAKVGTMDHSSMNLDRKPHDLPVMDRRELAGLGMFWALSGVSGTDEKPFLSARRGENIHVTLVNETVWPHAMHFHGHHFRVLTRNGAPEPGMPWRDTVLLDAEETVEIAFVADNPGKWMIHCHMLEHQSSGMMTWMDVT